MGKWNRKRRRKPTQASKLMAKRAKWMRNGKSTVHESITEFLLRDIAKGQGLEIKNQKIFHDDRSDKWYIADFYIPSLSLVIEIDGGSHNKESQIKYDNIRTNFLESIGNKVVRVPNEDVETLGYRDKLIGIITERFIELAKQDSQKLPNPKPKMSYYDRYELKALKVKPITTEEIREAESRYFANGGKVRVIG